MVVVLGGLLLFLLPLLLLPPPGAAALPAHPHILVVLSDDLGWNNVGFHGRNPEARTPHLDALVAGGVELRRHYVYKFCSPSRSAFQSGRLPVHVNDQNAAPELRNKSDPVAGFAGIPPAMTALPAKMTQAGYVTHMTGKWDAGMATAQHTPIGRGYAAWLGYFHRKNSSSSSFSPSPSPSPRCCPDASVSSSTTRASCS
jgi:arylsulfatase B